MNLYEQPEDAFVEETQMSVEDFKERKEACQYLISKSKDAAELAKNPQFESIIMQDYFVKEPQRLGSLLASGKLTPKGFEDAVSDLRAIGHLRTYMQDFISKGNLAQEELDGLEEAYEDAVNAGEIV